MLKKGVFKYGKLKMGVQYLWNENGSCLIFDVNGNIINDSPIDIRNMVKILVDIVTNL